MQIIPSHSRISLPFDIEFSIAIANSIKSISSDDFYTNILDLLGKVCQWDEAGAMIFYRDHAPHRFFRHYDPTIRSIPIDYYLTGPYALDPLYHVFLKGAPTGVYSIRSDAPDEFLKSEFYKVFYSKIGLIDYVDIMWRIDENSAFIYYMERNTQNSIFQPTDMVSLQLMVPLISSISEIHYNALNEKSGLKNNDHMHQKVKNTMENFASSILTNRERQVLLHILRGFSAATSAEQLKTKEATIRMHRKNIYRKLDITSQGALFSLFINCISLAEPNTSMDPLLIYQRGRFPKIGPRREY